MTVDAVVWTLRGLAALYALILLIAWFRTLRVHRATQFKARPSTAQGLAGRYMPSVSVLVPSADGTVGPWVGRLSYPGLEVIVAVPPGAEARGLPPGARLVRSPAADRGALLAAGTLEATGEILVVLPAEMAVGRGFLKRLVAPLVDPFVGASIPRVVQSRPGATIAARVDDIERLARSGVQLGRHVIGAAVMCDREPFAARRMQIYDVGGWNPSLPAPELDLVMRLYVRGFVISFVEEAVALAPSPRWDDLSGHARERVAGMRRLWRRARAILRRSKVLEGPEKTDVRWLTRGSAFWLWLLVGWILTGALRVADTSWAPDAVGAVLVLVSFTTIAGAPFFNLSAVAVQTRRRTVLALEPWMLPLGLGNIWTGAGAALASPWRRGGRAARGAVVAPAEMPAPRRAPRKAPRRAPRMKDVARVTVAHEPPEAEEEDLAAVEYEAEPEPEEPELEVAGGPEPEVVEEAELEEVEEPELEEVEEPELEEVEEPEIAIEQPKQRTPRKRRPKAVGSESPPIWESR